MPELETPLGVRPGPSGRGELARLALEAALAVDGVVRSEGGPRGAWVTEVEGERVAGVVAAAQADGRYAVALHLVARPVPLHQLAERIRDRVLRSADRAGLGPSVGTIHVSIEDVEALEGPR